MAASSSSKATMANRLAKEKSPYLLQHAHNPVDWYPWGPEAFEAAKAKDKLIFLSVGYSTCHWCHVMERESFESAEVAKIMNEHYINVKVDREERPDVDKVYMTFVQASSGGGGWPMSVFITPNLKPIFGGTYFPPEDMYGRPGFKSLLLVIAEQWESDRQKLIDSGDKIITALKKTAATTTGGAIPASEDVTKKCFAQLLQSFDPEYGGFSRAPKFPQPVNFNFLFEVVARKPEEDRSKQALRMCIRSLEMMALGGINDHVSKGFARYSTDSKWHVPHFEKMLYDQGQLAVAFAQAFQATQDRKFAKVVQDIVEYVCRDLRHPKGGFYSAEDADSYPEAGAESKKEGAFCVWTKDELEQLIPDEKVGNGTKTLLDLFCSVFKVKPGGNVDPSGDPHGELKNKNVLTKVDSDIAAIKSNYGLGSDQELDELLEKCCNLLHEARLKRPRPHLDDKILTSWNGLMISGLCQASAALQSQDFAEEAIKTAEFIKKYLFDQSSGSLLRSAYPSPDDKTEIAKVDHVINGFVDDYAYVIKALLDLYEVSFDPEWIEWAHQLQQRQDELFWDDEAGGYFTSPSGDESIVLRLKEDQDGAEPASNSVSAGNLLRLASFLDEPGLRAKADKIFEAYSQRLAKIPLAIPEMARALMSRDTPPPQIIITGSKTSSKAKEMIQRVQTKLMPSTTLILADGNKDSILYKKMKLLSDLDHSKVQAFVCKNMTCSAPVESTQELEKLLL